MFLSRIKCLSTNINTISKSFVSFLSQNTAINGAFALKQRTLLRVQGKDSIDFLQGIVTNDMRHLDNLPDTSVSLTCMYAMMLNNVGRVLYDLILYKLDSQNDQDILIECDKDAETQVVTLLKMYKLRKDVSIMRERNKSVWHICDPSIEQSLKNCVVYKDPRLSDLGFRVISPTDYQLPLHEGKPTYQQWRYMHGVAEGIKEHLVAKCIPLETNIEYLHGISFHKGCYIGQELTARAYHTGVIRKRIMPLELDSEQEVLSDDTAIVTENAKMVGVLRAWSGKYAIGLMRWQEALDARELRLKNSQRLLNVRRPSWWSPEPSSISAAR